jgi:hypothetical protein
MAGFKNIVFPHPACLHRHFVTLLPLRSLPILLALFTFSVSIASLILGE